MHIRRMRANALVALMLFALLVAAPGTSLAQQARDETGENAVPTELIVETPTPPEAPTEPAPSATDEPATTETPADTEPTATDEPAATAPDEAAGTPTAEATEERSDFSASGIPVASFGPDYHTTPGALVLVMLTISMDEATTGGTFSIGTPPEVTLESAQAFGDCAVGSSLPELVQGTFSSAGPAVCTVTIGYLPQGFVVPGTTIILFATVSSVTPLSINTTVGVIQVDPVSTGTFDLSVDKTSVAPGDTVTVTVSQTDTAIFLFAGSVLGSIPPGTTLVTSPPATLVCSVVCSLQPVTVTDPPTQVTGTYYPLLGIPTEVTLTYQVTIDPDIAVGTVLTFSGQGSVGLQQPTGPDSATVTVIEPVVAEDALLSVPNGGTLEYTLSATGGVPGYTFILAQGPGDGPFALMADGSFTYSPAPGVSGTRQILYKVLDSAVPANSDDGTVTITIGDPLTATDTAIDVPFEGSGSGAVTAAGGTAPVAFALQDAPAKGTATVNPDGSFTYEAADGQTGADQFTILATDSGDPVLTAVATVDVTIGAPDALVAASLSLNVDAGATVSGTLADQVSGGIPPYTFAEATGPTQGTLTLNADGSFTYTADDDAEGTDTFTYTVTDSEAVEVAAAATTTGTVTVVIAAAPAPSPTATLEPGVTPTATSDDGNVGPGGDPGDGDEETPVDPRATVTADAGDNDGGDPGAGPITTLPSTGQGGDGGSSATTVLLLLLTGALLIAAGAAQARRRTR